MDIAGRSPAELEKVSDRKLVWAYSHQAVFGPDKKLKAEIERRNLFTADQWQRIESKTFRLGDPESVVWASWGTPDDVSTLSTVDGASRVLIYGDHANNRVYIDNGIVTALGQ